ncbi:hypothetical protein [Zavarzinella formosa]|uniref:hypothetical protein n=1 Tax=Zavarzinella formosa TaxID=360055 RepID=UPI00030EB56E|nr:hypothetical protein [Zavarzinella formosa]
MKKLVLAMLLAAAGFVSSASAQTPGCTNCGDQGGGYPASYGGPAYGQSHFSNYSAPWMTHPHFGNPKFSRGNQVSRMPTLPVYMAAPWYLYWPYDGHFQTVAPMAAMSQWMPPPQSAYGTNPALPTYPGYVPYVPNQNFPGVPGAGTAPATPIPSNIPAPAVNPVPAKPLPAGTVDKLPPK